MIINVSTTVRIRHEDGCNWTIEQMRISQKSKRAGEPIWYFVGHYSSGEQAARALLSAHIGLLVDDATTELSLEEFLSATEREHVRTRLAIEEIAKRLTTQKTSSDHAVPSL